MPQTKKSVFFTIISFNRSLKRTCFFTIFPITYNFEEIKQKLKKNINLENIEIIDNSHKHKKHKFFSANKFHLELKIKSQYLNSISRLNAQKKIMKILEEDLKNKIHAIEIKIEQ